MSPARGVILAILLICPLHAFGQGTVRGVVSDSTGNQRLPGANVFLVGTAMGAVTNLDGAYTLLRIPAGAYRLRISYIGYVPKEVAVSVQDNIVSTVNVDLLPDVIEGSEVVILGQARGQSAAINQQLNANTIVNVISEEKIQELPDANAAEAIGRLPGVSILRSGGEANKVILRGLDAKFTTVTVDGVKIPPTDADARGVDLSTISQGSLAGVELFKALTPDKEADAIGGTINLVTRKAPTERLVRLDARGIYNQLMNDVKQYDFALRYGERFFSDALGVQVTGNMERRNRSNERENRDYNQALQGGRDYEMSDFLLEFTDEIRTRNGVSLLLDLDTPDGGNIRLNNMYGLTKRDYLFSTRNYPFGTGDRVSYAAREREQEIKTFNSSLQGQNTLLDLNLKWGLSFAQSKADDPYDFYIDFIEPSVIENGIPVAGMKSGMPSLKDSPELFIPYALNNFQAAYAQNAYYRSEANLDKERSIFLDIGKPYSFGELLLGEFKVGGRYKVKDRTKESSQRYSPYYLGYWREFTAEPGSTPVKKNLMGTWFEPFYRRFLANNGARIPVASDFLDASPRSRNLYDKYQFKPILNRDALRQWYELNKYGIDSIGRTLEYFDDPQVATDYYDVDERVSGVYAMNTLNYGQSITFIAGVRLEAEDNDYRSRISPAGLGGFPIPTGIIRDTLASHKEQAWLPNVQLLLKPTEYLNVRFAAYRALARPDFNLRLEKFVSSGFSGTLSLLLGNPQLKSATAWNYEANASLYGNAFGLISVSGYYKEIKDMFHMLNNASTVGNQIIDVLGIRWRTPHTGVYSLTAPYNSPRPTKVWGFELEHQMDFSFLPGLLKNLVLSYNASIVRSETWIYGTELVTTYVKTPTGFPPPFDSVSVPVYSTKLIQRKQKLEGQPEFYANVALGYDIGGLSVRLSMFHQAEYNSSFSALGTSDGINNAFTRFDLALKYDVTNYLSVMLNFNNLTNIYERNTLYNRNTGWKILNTSENYGRTADLGVRVGL